MKKQFLIAFTLFATLSLAGCGQDEQTVKINFPTASASGTLYAVGAAITHLWSEEIPHVRAASMSSAGGIDNLNMVADGEAQVSIAIASNVVQCQKGIGPFTGHPYPDIKVMAGLYLNPNQILVSETSGIETLSHVKGKRFAIAAAGSSVYDECKTHFTLAGLQFPSDFTAETIAFSDSAELLQNGTIDGAWVMSGVPASAVSQALASGARLISLDDEFLTQLKKEHPWYTTYIIPAGTYPHQPKEVKTSAVKMILFCRGDMNDELVYRLTKTFWKHIKELGTSQKTLKGLTPENAIRDIGNLPLHPGAARYYAEIGLQIKGYK